MTEKNWDRILLVAVLVGLFMLGATLVETGREWGQAEAWEQFRATDDFPDGTVECEAVYRSDGRRRCWRSDGGSFEVGL